MKLGLALFSLMMTMEVFRGRSQSQSCLSTTDELVDLENSVQDFSQFRSYVLCPNSIFKIAYLDYSNNRINGSTSPMIPIRPNLEIKCGVDGSRSNNFFVYGGDVQVDATFYFDIGVESALSVENVLISGITFSSSRGYSVLATRPGNLTFRDCEFQTNTKAIAPVYLDYFDQSSPDEALVVAFEECEFNDNVYSGQPAQTALIVGNSLQNRINISDSVFKGNDLIFNNTLSATNSFLIESYGPLTLQRNCFLDNALGVSAAVVYGVPIEASSNYGLNSSGDHCEFAAVFDNDIQQVTNFTPQCLNFDATFCQASLLVTAAPIFPSDSPSISPSQSPSTRWPSWSPSLNPSSSPSKLPTTDVPSSYPSSLPSALPTTFPSPIPSSAFPSANPSSAFPSAVPSSAPTSLAPSHFPSNVPTKPRPKPKPLPKRQRTDFPTPAPSNATVTSSAFRKVKIDALVYISTLACAIMMFG